MEALYLANYAVEGSRTIRTRTLKILTNIGESPLTANGESVIENASNLSVASNSPLQVSFDTFESVIGFTNQSEDPRIFFNDNYNYKLNNLAIEIFEKFESTSYLYCFISNYY